MIERRSVLALAGLAAMAACTTTTGPQVGADGRPLPKVYRINPSEYDAIFARMQESVNAVRTASALAPLQYSQQLNTAAGHHAVDMSKQNRPWHFGSDGSSPLDRVQRVGYTGRLQGELVAETFETETETLSSWMSQQDTRAVVLDPSSTEMGFSWWQEESGKIWWVLLTGNSTGGAISNYRPAAIANTRAPSTEVIYPADQG